MANVIKQLATDLNDSWKRSDLSVVAPGARQLTVGIGELSNDLNDFGQGIDGSKARRATDKAADLQNRAQLDSEAASRHQKRLAENSAEYKKTRDAQKIAQMVSGGRAGTLMNGTAGVQTLGAGPGKTLLGS